jgi:hypothetical protein
MKIVKVDNQGRVSLKNAYQGLNTEDWQLATHYKIIIAEAGRLLLIPVEEE